MHSSQQRTNAGDIGRAEELDKEGPQLDALQVAASVTDTPSERTLQHARARIALRNMQSLALSVDPESSVDGANCLLVHREGRWFKPPGGGRVDLSRKRTFC